MPSKDPVSVEYELLEFENELQHYATELETSDRKDQGGNDWKEEDVPF